MADTSLNDDRLGLLIWQTSNIWQSKLRKVIKDYNISLNEYLIIETIYKLKYSMKFISQINIAKNSHLDVAVVSTNLSILERKKLIKRTNIDNRSKNIQITNDGLSIIKSLINNINKEEINFFNILGNETFNFIILLKLLLGKKIRIKANKNNE